MKPIEKWLDLGLLLLGISLLVRIYLLSTSPIVEIAKPTDAPHVLHEPNAAERLLPLRLNQVGSYVTVEDVIRHLEANPNLLNPQAIEILKDMQVQQTAILEAEEAVQATEIRLNQLALEIYDGLSEQEKIRIRQSRNVDSVNGIEAKYWRSLIDAVEKEP